MNTYLSVLLKQFKTIQNRRDPQRNELPPNGVERRQREEALAQARP